MIGCVLFLVITSFAQTYQWSNVAMGGGGFVSGIITSKKEQNLMYARTDVGGAYRWNVANSSWIPLLDWTSESQTGYQGVESLAIDPQSPNKLYMLVGTSYFNNGNTAILSSTDYGNTFTITDVSSQFKAHGNGMGRNNGEKLVVDPNNGNILFCGTRRNGLFKSSNSGANWSQVASLGTIVTPNDNGISFVVIDSLSATSGSSQSIFVGVSNTGTNFYASTDGGTNFTAVTGAPAGLMPQRAVMAKDRNLYITYADKEGPYNAAVGQIWKYNTQTFVWTNVTPPSTNYPYSGISVDPNNPQRLIASTINVYTLQYGSTYGDRFYLSTDGGTTWRNLIGSGITIDPNGCTWFAANSIHWAASIEFNPYNTNEAWVVSGNGVFVCSNLAATNTTWQFGAKGLEETVPLDIVSITSGPLFSTLGDYDGFKHTDVTQYAPVHTPRMGSTSGIAFAALNTNKLLRVGSKMYFTNDQGNSWTECTINGTSGKVAISADGNTFLHCPANSTTTYRSVDNGNSWTACNGITINGAVPVADPVNSNKFYAFNTSNGFMQISTDGGATFTNAGSVSGAGSKIIRTAPGYEGHLWVAQQGSGLRRSINSGASFTKIKNVTTCTSVGLGKAALGASYYTIYIWGTVGGVLGLHRSIDEGATWVRVNDVAHQYGGPGNGQFVIGDMNVYGRAYMSTVGRGIAYVESSVVLPVTLVNFSGFLNNNSQTQLKWTTATEMNNNYFDVERSVDGKIFTKITTVVSSATNGNSTISLNYAYADDVSGFKSTIYYRLKQVDKDGKYTYSNVLRVNIATTVSDNLQVYPNPVISNNVNLKVQLFTDQNVQVRITDMLGSIVYKSAAIKLFAGSNLLNLTQSINLNKGTYVVQLFSDTNKTIIGISKMIVQ